MHEPRRLTADRSRLRPLVAVGLALLLSTSLSAQIWSEEFNSGTAPDSNVWSYDLGASGWGNNEFQNYTNSPSNVRVQGGNLIITALRQTTGGPPTFTSARIKTQDKLTFQYGTVEARIKVPDLGNGLWPAFWTLGNNFSSVGWPDCGEIDVLEMGSAEAISGGVVNRRVHSAAHWESNGSHALYSLSRVTPNNLNGSFHIFRMEWTPTAISTYVDGQWIWTMDISNPNSFDGHEFHHPHFFILNLAVGGNFTGINNRWAVSAPFPAEYVVDYVRIYDNGFTTLGGSSLSTPASTSVRSGLGNFNASYTCSAPVLGTSMTANLVVFGAPYQLGTVYGYLGAAYQPFGNFTILVDTNSTPLLQLPFQAFTNGFTQWSVPIPAIPAFSGLPIKTQALMLGPGIGLTNAVDLIVGN